ncbi:MAG: 23S rRNA (adenine(2503)-C(2))-methyltransferase RlmN [Thermoanaerobaculia bacterium]
MTRQAGGGSELLGLGRESLATRLAPHLDRPFRARQIFDAIHLRAVTDFSEMTDLSRPLREELAAAFAISLPEVSSRVDSADGTTKFLLRLADGASIEAVDIPETKRRTLCISSQAGCGLACAFCVTGYWGAGRNLTAGEIVAQVLLVRRLQNLPPTLNLVFMGMGEPLLNVESVHTALELLSESISWRRMTVSTAGVVPGLDAMAAWDRRPNLAISLHAPDDARRDEIMPINRSYPLAELLDALRRFPLEPRRRITIEYILLAGFNDSPGDAAALARLLRKIPVKINLIPFNPDPVLGDRFVRPSPESISRFQEELAARHLTATVRRTRGDDVGAACGQLRAFAREPRARNPRRPPRGEFRS